MSKFAHLKGLKGILKGITLDKDNRTAVWSFEEEDDDSDFFFHTLFVKNAVLGASAQKDEVNIIEVETVNYQKEELRLPLVSLTAGQNNMCPLDISFDDRQTVTFRLLEPAQGPVSINAQHLVEYPDENEYEYEIEPEPVQAEEPKKEDTEHVEPDSTKRKASPDLTNRKSKRGKMDDSSDDDDDDDDPDYEFPSSSSSSCFDDDDDDESDDDETEDEVDESDEFSGPGTPRNWNKDYGSSLYYRNTTEQAKGTSWWAGCVRKIADTAMKYVYQTVLQNRPTPHDK